jgi:tetratricopeptide (TPR) repeat protein
VAKRKLMQQVKKILTPQNNSLEGLQTQLQMLMRQKNYRQALDKLKHIQKTYPDAKLETSEAHILSLRGQQEYGQGHYRQAEKSFHQAIDLGLQGEPHYWLSKCFLALDESSQALAVVQGAFERKELPKDYGGCFLKLLFLNDSAAMVAELIEKQSKRFFAPQLHWARGILELQAKDYEAAIAHFKKMGIARLLGWPMPINSKKTGERQKYTWAWPMSLLECQVSMLVCQKTLSCNVLD